MSAGSLTFIGWAVAAVLAFWAAYVTTRPLGASFADWMAVRHQDGGLGWGTGPVTAVLLTLILAMVAWLSWTGQDVVESLDLDAEPGLPDGPRV